MKMRFWKLLSLAAAAALLIGGGPAATVPAAVGDTIEPEKTGSLEIHKYDITGAVRSGAVAGDELANGLKNPDAEQALREYAIKGVEFTCLRVADISTELKNGKLRVVYDIPEDLAGILGGGTRQTGDTLNQAAEALFTGDERIAAKNRLEAYVTSHGGTAMPLTDAQGLTDADSLPLGLYLIAETKVPENVMSAVDPFFVSLPMTDPTGDRWIYEVSVYPKNQTDQPTLEKEVRSQDDRKAFGETATASEGDVLDFRISSKLPGITSAATYLSRYDYIDSMSAGISYNKDTSICFYRNEKDAAAKKNPLAVWEKGSAFFKIRYEEAGEDGRRHMKICMTRKGLQEVNPALSGAVMVICYSGTVSSGQETVLGTEGNPNDVELTWSRTNTDEYDTLTDRTVTFTFGIHLQKVFSDGRGDPEKVQFILHNDTDGYYVAASKTGGEYFVCGKADSEKKASVLVPGADGWLDISGIEAEDDFTLTEIQTDSGYTLLRDPVRIHIAQDGTATADGKDISMVSIRGGENAAVQIAVRNTREVDLPRTGGWGTLAFTLAGGAAVLAGLFLTSGDRKRRGADA